MGLDVETMRSKLRNATGTDEDDMPDAEADLYLNLSYWDVLDRFKFREKEVLLTFATAVGERFYSVPSPFEALRNLAIVHPTSLQHIPLNRKSEDWYEGKYQEGSDSYAIPTDYIREGCGVRLWPTPDQVYTIVERYWTVLTDLVAGTQPGLPQTWHEIVLYGAYWRAFLDQGAFDRSAATKKLQESLINTSIPMEAKEEIDSPRAGLEVLRRSDDYLG